MLSRLTILSLFVLSCLLSQTYGQTLQIVSLTPNRNQNNVARNNNIMVEFNQNINGGTLNDSTFILRSSQTGIIPGNFLGSGTTTITFDPDNNFKAGEVITVTITTTLESSGGSTLTSPVSYQFTTAVDPAPKMPVVFKENIITTDANGATFVFASDIDSDGDMDVLSASEFDNKIAWYENDGNQNFTTDTISINASFAASVHTADIDKDGDMDVLSASRGDDKIVWYENDGNQNFTDHTISDTANGAISVFASDVDGDGDTDVLSASRIDFTITWYEDTGSQNFTSHVIVDFHPVRGVYAADVDSDGDIDALSASEFGSGIAWYENDGNQNFGVDTISANAVFAHSVYTADLDDDGDMDILSASSSDDRIAWYENDGNQNFTPHIITTNALSARSVYATDVNGDGYLDVLSASSVDLKIAWYENDGNQNFTSHTISDSAGGAISVYAVDIDSDGDMDVLSAAYFRDEIVWYENIDPGTGINDQTINILNNFQLHQNYPNPFNPTTTIEYMLPHSAPVKLTIYNSTGQIVRTLINKSQSTGSHKITWDGKDDSGKAVASGVYLYHLEADDFVQTRKMLLLR